MSYIYIYICICGFTLGFNVVSLLVFFSKLGRLYYSSIITFNFMLHIYLLSCQTFPLLPGLTLCSLKKNYNLNNKKYGILFEMIVHVSLSLK